MRNNRSEAAGRQSRSSNSKRKPDQRSNHRKVTGFPDKLLAHPGAKNALDRLEAGGMNREVTTAFLFAITFGHDDSLRRELPDPENLRSLAARVLRVADEIGAINRNVYLNPKRLLETYPGVDKSYARMFALLPGTLAAYSEYLQFAAYLTGDMGKTKLSTAKLFVVKMLQHAKETTGREHYDDIALLLEATEEACGRSAEIDPSALKMLLRRHRSSMARPRSLRSLPKSIRERIRIDKALESDGRHLVSGLPGWHCTRPSRNECPQFLLGGQLRPRVLGNASLQKILLDQFSHSRPRLRENPHISKEGFC